MGAKSLLELLKEEFNLCNEVQVRINILVGLRESVADGTVPVDKHSDLEERLSREISERQKALYPLRLAIGAKILDLQAMAERAIAANLERAELAGADVGEPV